MANPLPAHVIRIGRIKAAIWSNQSELGTRHNVTFERLYRQDDEWRKSDSFGRDDLLVLAKAADMAHTWIFEHAADQGSTTPADTAT